MRAHTVIRWAPLLAIAVSLSTACTFDRMVPGVALESITGRDIARDASALEARRDSAAQYLSQRFAALGLTPGNAGQWMQDVPLTQVAVDTNAVLDVRSRGVFQRFHAGTDVALSTARLADTVGFWNAPMVFVGYRLPGRDTVNAADLRGRMVVLLADSDGSTEDLAEVARRGAIGALVVVPPETDSTAWAALRDSVARPRSWSASTPRADTALAVEGWINDSAAARLFGQAGLSLARERARAREARFTPMELQLYASTHLDVTVTRSLAHNVLAEMRGTDRANEYVMYSAGWDATAGDAHGATSVAALLALATAFKALGMPPSRSVVFLATLGAGEPSLGSEYYAVHPPHPLATTVADLDVVARPGSAATEGVSIAGARTATDLEGFIDAAARDQERGIERSRALAPPAALAERGVPAIAVAADSVRDVRLLFRAGYRLANARTVAPERDAEARPR